MTFDWSSVIYSLVAIVVLCVGVELVARWRTRREDEQFKLEEPADSKLEFDAWYENAHRELYKAHRLPRRPALPAPEVSQVVARPPTTFADVELSREQLGDIAVTTVKRDCCCECEDDHE